MNQNFSLPFLWLLKILFFYRHFSFYEIKDTPVCQFHFYLPFWAFIGLCQSHIIIIIIMKKVFFTAYASFHLFTCSIFKGFKINSCTTCVSSQQPRSFSFSSTYLHSDIFGQHFHFYQFRTPSFIFYIIATGGFYCPVFEKWYNILIITACSIKSRHSPTSILFNIH